MHKFKSPPIFELNVAVVAVSLVDGFNLPMRITNNKGCPVADCPVDLAPSCELDNR